MYLKSNQSERSLDQSNLNKTTYVDCCAFPLPKFMEQKLTSRLAFTHKSERIHTAVVIFTCTTTTDENIAKLLKFS